MAQLRASGDLDGEPRPTQRMANFYEKGDKPLEIVTSRQWYIRNGGRDADLREALVARGREITWVPTYMQHRYENWVNGLNGDWLISRQRFFGVPVPGLVPRGRRRRDRLRRTDLRRRRRAAGRPQQPDPAGVRRGASAAARAGSSADPDVMDTWATSSLSPQIVGGWTRDDDLFARVFPMDLRPQAHDIIRTWLFSTVVRVPPRARRRAVEPRRDLRLRRRPGPQEDEQVQGQRRGADRHPRAVTAPTPSAGARPRPARAPTARSTRPR